MSVTCETLRAAIGGRLGVDPARIVVSPGSEALIDYLFRAVLIPFLILSLAALGLNILVGYCGQISLGTGAFMAVGAYAAYNTFVRIEGMPLIVALLSGGFFATLVGMFFGIPSLRVKGLYLAVATLAAQFFCDWAFLRIGWFTNNNPSGSVSVSDLQVFGLPVETPLQKYLFCLAGGGGGFWGGGGGGV